MTPPFSLFDQAEDRFEDLAWGQVLVTPFELGAWALLEPMGEQNHAPQLCWIRPDLLGCVWMAGSGECTAGMSVFLSLLGLRVEVGRNRSGFPEIMSGRSRTPCCSSLTVVCT